MKKILVAFIIIVLAAPALTYFSDSLFWDRYFSLVKARIDKQPRGVWYSPLESVAGAKTAADQISPNQNELRVRSPATQDDNSSLQPGIPESALERAYDYIADRNSSSFIVWHRDQIVQESYFNDTARDTLIVSKSMAKPLATMVVARAIQQGYISSLDQSAAIFIDEWQGTPKEAITIRHILNMSSGLHRFYENTLNPFSYFHKAFLSSKHEQIIIEQMPLVDEPGSYYDYSQATSDLITMIVERATGVRYSEYLSEQLLVPIGAAGGDIWINREAGVAHSGCCIMLPARTWLRLGILMVQDGVWNGERLLPDSLRSEILKGSDTNPNYALNFWLGSPYEPRRFFINPDHLPLSGVLQSEPYLADDLFMFDGNGSQVVYIVPSHELVILRTGDWPISAVDGTEWDNTFLPNTIIGALNKNPRPAAVD